MISRVPVRLICFVFVAVLGGTAIAATVDGGVQPGEYGSALAIQDTPTGYGDANGVFGGSELDAVFATMSGGDLELAITGNLEDGGNGLVIFLDTRAGGAVSSFLPGGYGVIGSIGGQRSDDWGTDTDGGGGVNPTPGGGSILDPGFNPDLALQINIFGGTYFTNVIDFALPNSGDPDVDVFLGGNSVGAPAATHTYFRDDFESARGHNGAITHAFDNSNTVGVTSSDASGAATATTGYEALLSSEFLAGDGQPVRLMAFISNGSGEYLSNQFLPGLGGVANLDNAGGPGGVPLFDAREFAGSQYVVVPVPEPTGFLSLAMWLGCASVGSRRSR